MDKAQTSKGRLRFRLYYRLMDVCLVFAVIGAIDWFISPYDRPEDAPVWFIILAVFTLTFNFAVPFFLIVARFMRDDYAEALWRRSLVILGYGVTVLPVVIFIAGWAPFFLLVDDPTTPLEAPDYIRWFVVDEQTAFEFMVRLWLIFLLSFVAIFQFLRWRDSR